VVELLKADIGVGVVSIGVEPIEIVELDGTLVLNVDKLLEFVAISVKVV
jgi:hypothetical protein